jgi:hypothetical protein
LWFVGTSNSGTGFKNQEFETRPWIAGS